MSRNDLRNNEFAWRAGVKPSRIQPPQQRARSLYERAHDKARRALLAHGQTIAPSRGGAR